MTIAHLAYRLAHEFNGGAAALATMMGKGEKVLQSKLNPNTETHHLSIDELEMLADFTDGNIAVAEYFAEKSNAIVMLLPTIPDLSDMGLLDSYMAIMREFGELSSEFQKAYADGEITDKEFKRIAHEVSAVQGKLLAFQSAIKQVVR